MCLFWLVRSLGVRIFELRCLGVRYFGWSPFSGCSDLWALLLGGSEIWVSCILASCLGVRYFGWSLFSGCSYLWASLLGGSEFWVYGILVAGYLGSAHLDHRISVSLFAAGRMVLRVFSWVAWHAGSCFSAAYDASTQLGHSNECSLYVQ